MKINPTIFKPYDIRAKVPSELNEAVAERIGNAVAVFLSQRRRKKRVRILVCREVRYFSEKLRDAFVRGVLAQGSDVLDAGLGTTPFFYYLMHTVPVDGGVMVSASHNPAGWNGFKIRGYRGKAIAKNSGLWDIKRLVLAGHRRVAKRAGEVRPAPDYTNQYLSFVCRGIRIERPVKGIVDASGGSASIFLPRLLSRFPAIAYKPLFFTPDGSFHAHSPNPILPEAQRYVRAELKKGKGFRFGAIFDADGDRVFFLDEKGERIPAEFIAGLLMQEEIKHGRRGPFIFTPNTSRGVREVIRESGARVLLSRVGYVFVQQAMRQRRALIGTETSGHFYFKTAFADDSAFHALLAVVELLSKTHRPLSTLVAPFRRYYSEGELNFSVVGTRQALARVAKFYKKSGTTSRLDGITVETPQWWFNLRPSNTEPILRLVLEARTKEVYRERLREILPLLQC